QNPHPERGNSLLLSQAPSVSQTIVYGVRAGGIAMTKNGHDRREFVGRAFCLTLGAGISAYGLRGSGAQAQTPPRPIRRSERYDDSFINERKPFKWPGNATIAIWFAPNVEVWQY